VETGKGETQKTTGREARAERRRAEPLRKPRWPKERVRAGWWPAPWQSPATAWRPRNPPSSTADKGAMPMALLW